MLRSGSLRRGMLGQGGARYVFQLLLRFGLVGCVWLSCVSVPHGGARFGKAGFGAVRCGYACYGHVGCGSVSFGFFKSVCFIFNTCSHFRQLTCCKRLNSRPISWHGLCNV